MKSIQKCTHSYKTFNEDSIGSCGNLAWVIDGASGLSKKKWFSHKSDVRAYVDFWQYYLKEASCSKKNIKDILKDGILKIKKEFNINKSEKEDFPSAAISVIRKIENELEYFILGDCSLLYEDFSQKIYFKDKRVNFYDDQVINYMKNKYGKTLFEEKFEFSYPKDVLEELKKNRTQKNKGYWILELQEQAIDKGIYGKILMKQDAKVLLMSDGFSAIMDSYKLLDEIEMFKNIKQKGLKCILKNLRTAEDKDKEGINFPRLRCHDDASAVYIEW